MVFRTMRKRFKGIVWAIAITFVLGLLYVGGSALWRGNPLMDAAVASVNGKEIGYIPWYNTYWQLVQSQQAAGMPVTADQAEFVQYYALQQLIGHELLLQEANARKIKPSKAEIDAQLQALKEEYGGASAFAEQLAASNLTEADIREAITESLKIEELRNQVTANVTVTLDEVKTEYEEVKASHILIRPDGSDDEAWNAALAEAEEVLERLRTGEDFAEVAKEVSQDGSAQEGGDLGWFKRGDMVPEFSEAAFALAIGEISEPVRSQYGYHIIKVFERKTAEGEEFAAAEAELREEIRERKQSDEFNAWYAEVVEKAEIEVRDPRMRGYEALRLGNYEEAAEAYQEATAFYPDDPYLYSSLASVYDRLGRTEDALEQLKIAVEKTESDPELYLQLGDKYRVLEREEEAVTAYSKASELAPEDFMIHLQLLNAYTAMGRQDLVAVEEEKLAEIQRMYAEMSQASVEEDSTEAEDESAEVETSQE
ncbi:MAG: tetratricopeptide repeat protein [Firmicutes bacterium]|nr:tetratricopeptide repeat protein [Bacillota bacterium]